MDEATVVATLTELLAIPSIGGAEGEAAIQHRLAERLGDLGLDVDLWPLDLADLRQREDYPGEEVDRTTAWGLVATNQPGERPALILEGHVDVVPIGDPAAWTSEPFRPQVSGGRVIGRGACDMKGGVAAILGAVQTVQRAGSNVPPYAVHFVVGEEDGGLGAYATLARGHHGDACIIPEPTDLGLVTANAGSLTFRIEVPGLATHGSTRYAGSSAIESYLPIHRALAELERRRNARVEPLMQGYPIPYPLSVGRVRAGDWPSSVPDLLVAEGRYGLYIEEEPSCARAQLETAVADAAERDPYLREHPPRVSWPGGQFRGGRLPAGHPFGSRLADLHRRVTGRELSPGRGVSYGSDLRLYAGAGIPTLHYGPGSPREAHGPDESVPIEEVVAVSKVLALALAPGTQD
ncbi:MAG TPA: ArgE/DapE family deacylase [Propionibacteriaceae bacterium]|nr:ArgE/DapE family deacylase [Propionibacteriaceae bacterium]